MRCQLVYSVVIFSHRFLDSDCIIFKTFAFLAVYWPFWTSLYSTDIKVQQFFKSFSTMLNNVFKEQVPPCCEVWQNDTIFLILWKFAEGSRFAITTHSFLSLCSPCSTFGTSAHSPDLTFGTNRLAVHNELNPIVLHLLTQWHCLELSLKICRIPIVSYTDGLLALSLLLIFP